MEKFSLRNKNIVITGASSGIGRQCAVECSKAGARAVLIARNKERLEETLNQLDGEGHLIFSIDITEYEKIKNIIDETVNAIGKIDGFIHSAGIELTKPFSLTKPAEFENLYKVNVVSGFEFARIISSNKYINENGGSFIFIASVMSVVSTPAIITYSASKGALAAGVKSMALELASKKIRVNCISPGVVETDLTKSFLNKLTEEAKNEIYKMHPLGIGKPDDVANACIYLLSDESGWMTGSNLIIDGGYSAG